MSFQSIIFFCLILTIISDVLGKSTRIVGGEDADIRDFPYMVSISMLETGRHNCGGVIISNCQILTAAHCFVRYSLSELVVYVGRTNSSDFSQRRYNILDVRKHPDFTGKMSTLFRLHNDIAIATLDGCIEFDEYARSIKLPTKNLKDGTPVTIVGWGKLLDTHTRGSEILQKASVNILNNNDCAQVTPFYLHDEQICTFKKKGIGSCIGDSGGPVVYNDVLIGIGSLINPCAEGFPDISTRVFSYLQFIKLNMINAGYATCCIS